jgi:aminoglycoside phosphotransferase (APT) family kinase protein
MTSDVEALAVALAEVLGPPVAELRQLSAGAHRETWSFVAADGTRCILQRIPPGDGVHAGIEFEARILRAAAEAGVPVARVLALCEPGGPLQTAALVLEEMPGEALPQRLRRDPRYSDALQGLAAQCGATLARLHAIPADVVPGLGPQDPIQRCYDVLDRLNAFNPAFELVLRRLDLTRPEPRPQTIVHGDFRLGNLLIDEHGISAVLDWELVHLGDPLEDLGYLCVPAWRFGGERPVAGVGAYETLLDAYREAGGEDVTLKELVWWQTASTVWWGVLCLVQASRHLSGETRSVELAAIGRRACEQEWDALAMVAALG